jgi:hypothetical protein
MKIILKGIMNFLLIINKAPIISKTVIPIARYPGKPCSCKKMAKGVTPLERALAHP